MIETNIVKKIKESKNIAIIIHVNPDNDCLGSGLSLFLGLNKIGKNCSIFCDDIISEKFHYFKGIENLNKYNSENFDFVICCDTATFNRLGKYKVLLSKSESLNIDHHFSNEKYGSFNIVETKASCSEVMFNFLKEIKIEIDKDMAFNLFSGLIGDTGGFQHSSTTESCFEMAIELMKTGINIERVNYYTMKVKTLKSFKLFQKAITNVSFFFNNLVSLMVIDQNMLNEVGASEKDTTGFVYNCVNIEGFLMGILITEEFTDKWAVSVRSYEPIYASSLCERFGGGGHKFAAGCKISGKKEEVIDKLLKNTKEILIELNLINS